MPGLIIFLATAAVLFAAWAIPTALACVLSHGAAFIERGAAATND